MRDSFIDEALLTRARAGAPDALAALYRRYGSDLLTVAYRIMNSAEDAEDVVQDVFVGLPEALRSYQHRGSFGAWLRRVTTRVALMRLRRQGRRQRRELLIAHLRMQFGNRDLSDRVVDRLALERALAGIPEPLRIVYVLKEILGHSHQEIAELLGVSAHLSETRLYRAKQQLARALGESA